MPNTFRPRGAPTAEPNSYVDSYNDWDLVHRGSMIPWGVYEKDGQTSAGFAWPSMITEPIEAGKRFLSPGGGFENLPNEQSTQDATTLLLSMYGGNALNPMARVPKNALAAEKKGLTGWHYSENSFDTFDPSKAQSGLTYAQGLHFLANKDATLAPEFGPYLYQAKIDASPNEVMNWSAPYDQQPEIVRNLMPKVGVPDRDRPYITDMHAAWKEYSKETGLDDWQISQQLRDAGIKVVDHGGHYVVIDDAAPEIVHKWAGNTQLYSDTGKPSIMGAALSSMSEPKNALAAGAVKAGEEPSLLGSALAGAQGERGGIIAYHGSPHDFDKFSLDKIGTGEGAQAYGHGLYFAENEGVAKSYRDTLAPDNAKYAAGQYKAVYGDGAFDAAVRDGDMVAADYLKAEKEGTAKAPGHMYQVKINANPEDFLDWDKPLSQQSEKVRQALASDQISTRLNHRVGKEPVYTMGDVLQNNGYSSYGNSLAMREAGIPGMRYLDQISRDKYEVRVGNETAVFSDANAANNFINRMTREGKNAILHERPGTSNYVMFDDSLIEILKKYGWLPPALYGADAMTDSSEAQASQGERPWWER